MAHTLKDEDIIVTQLTTSQPYMAGDTDGTDADGTDGTDGAGDADGTDGSGDVDQTDPKGDQ